MVALRVCTTASAAVCCFLAAPSVAQDIPPLPSDATVISAGTSTYISLPSTDDHVSQGLLGIAADAFEGGHEQARDDVAKAQAEGAGIDPSNTQTVIQEARDFEHEHNLNSVITETSSEEKAVREKQARDHTVYQGKIADLVNGPGMENLDSEEGRTPAFMGDTSATSPTLHGSDLHKNTSPDSPVPLWNSPDFRADLDALKYANGNYSQAIAGIARTARDAVATTSRVFLDLVKDLYTSDAPKGKASLANRSGFISTMYWKDQGEFKGNTQGLGCAYPLEYPHTHVSELEAEHMCNEMGLKCSGFSCNTEGERFTCRLCSGVTRKLVHSWREADKKPFFAMKAPDHMEWDAVQRRSVLWVEKFASLQKETEMILAEERAAVEEKFQVMLQRRSLDPDYDASNIAWKVRLDSAWRQEQFEEANWYAQLMKAEISRIDDFYNQVLNKLTTDVNMLNDKEKAKWNAVSLEELSNHTTAHDCWMAIRGVVYDFTYLAPHHPNKHSFIKHCGKDATLTYEDLGHEGRILNYLNKRIIGEFLDLPLGNGNFSDVNGSNSSNETVVDQFVRQRVRPTEALTQLAQRSSNWHDFTSEIQRRAAHISLDSASLLDLQEDETIGSIRPHMFQMGDDLIDVFPPSQREAPIWAASKAATFPARLVRREA